MSRPLDQPQQLQTAQLVSGEYHRAGAPPTFWQRRWRSVLTFCRLHPVLAICVVVIGVNLLHSGFNILYNLVLIKPRLDESQQAVFESVLTWYNVTIYPLCIVLFLWILRPIWRVHHRLVAGGKIASAEMAAAQKRLVDLPFYYVCLNLLGWLPGAFIFPLTITLFGSGVNAAGQTNLVAQSFSAQGIAPASGPMAATVQILVASKVAESPVFAYHSNVAIWIHFLLSFVVSALITIMQIFFLLEGILVRALYPMYFRDERPADMKGVVPRITFFWRLTMLYAAVGLMPMVAMMLVAYNVSDKEVDHLFALVVFLVGVVSAGLISLSMGSGLFRWLKAHQVATDELAQGNLTYRVQEKRPDEWGKLTDRFNDMAEALEDAEYMRRTFGQVKHPDVRDAIIKRYPGIGGEVCEITVLFSDIRGFTRRSAGQPPEKVFALLNRFLTLSVRAVEKKGGIVDKFLGDGIMALFNTPFKPLPNHADQALKASREMLKGLQELNEELSRQGEAPLTIGIGIHTGPALVGCPGATLESGDGKTDIRRDFTAIGETVNLSQRMEQFTKTLGGPILLSDQTRQHLRQETELEYLGEFEVPGYGGTLKVYRMKNEE